MPPEPSPRSSFVTATARTCHRRSFIGGGAGLTLCVAAGNSALAQLTTADLPDAAAVLQQVAPSPAPELSFRDASGSSLSLKSYRGQGLVVNIWATWCGPCAAELPTFAAANRSLAGSKILILPISVDLDGLQSVRTYFEAHKITDLPILLDPDGNALDSLSAQGIPVTVIINPRGQMVGRLEGSANWASPAALALVRQLAGPERAGGPEPA